MSSNVKSQKQAVKPLEPLREPEDVYREMFESAQDGIFQATANGQFILVNPALASMYDYASPEEMLATITDVAHGIFSDQKEYHRFIRQLKQDGRVDKFEAQVLRRDGSAIWVSISASVSDRGKGKYYQGFVRDITEHKQREISLRESERLYRQAIEAVGAVPYHQVYGRSDGRTHLVYQYIGEGIREITGYSPEEFNETLWNSLVMETQLLGELAQYSMQEAIQRVRSGKNPFWRCEFKIRSRDGNIRWVYETAVELHDETGVSQGSIGLFLDITERKLMEEKLRESEATFDSFMEHSPVHVFFKDKEIRSLRLSRNFEQLLGIPIADALGKTMDELFPSDLAKSMVADDLRILEQGQRVDVIEELNGRIYETTKFPIFKDGVPHMLAGFTMDITDRKLAEEELRESEASLKFSQQVAHVGNWTWDTANNRVAWSDEMYRIFGLDPETFDGDLDKVILASIHPDDRQKVIESNTAVLTEQTPSPLEYRVIWPDQSVHTVWAVPGAKTVDPDGKIIQLSGIVQDITERKRVEQALRENEEKMRSIFRVAPTGIGIVSNRILLDVNERICEMTGYAREELIGQSARILYPSQDEYDVVGRDKYTQITQKGTGIVETRWQKKDGTIINILLSSTPIDNSDLARGVTFTALDITERKHSEDAMRAIAEVGRDISSSLQLDDVLERIAFHARNLLDTETSAVYLVEETTLLLHAIAAVGVDADEIKNDPLRPGEGILGNIAIQKWGEIVNDSANDPRGIEIRGTGNTPPFEHLMGVPVLLRERLTGLIAVWRVGEGQEFKSSELDFLNSLAQQVAVAIENARLFKGTQRRLREMEAVVRVGTALSQTTELEPLLERILEIAIHAIPPAKRGSILLAGEDENLHIRAVWGYSDPRVRNLSFSLNSGYSVVAFREKRPIVIPNIQADETLRYEGDIEEMLPNGSAIAAPLIVKQNAIGVLAIDTPGVMDAFNDDDLQLLTAIAASAGLAIENTRLFDETRRRLSDLEILHSISAALRTAQTINDALPILLTQLMDLMDVTGATLEMLDRESNEIVTQLALGAWEPVTGMRAPRSVGVSGRVIATGKPYSSSDVVAEGLSYRPDLFAGLNCVACVPVISQHEPIGALWIGRQTRIKENEIGLLAAIGEMVGNAIHRMVLFEQAERQLKRLDSLRTIDRTINSSLDLRVTLNILLEQVVSQLDTDAAAVLILNPHSFTLEYAAYKGIHHANALGSLRLGESATSRVILERSMCSFPNLLENPGEIGRPALIANEKIQAYHAAPLIAKGQVRGVLEVFHRASYHPDAEWLAFLQSLAEQAAIAIDNAELFGHLQRSNDELTLAYDNTIAGWAHALDLREKETGDHSHRVTETSLKLAMALGVSDSELVHIRRGALLHDIGKVGIPDAILLKPEKLTEQEWDIMRMHPVYARDLLHPIAYLKAAINIPYCHHEKWDGSGYPQGLAGKAIPIEARIFAIVDVWDALLSKRPYRAAWPREKVLDYIRSQSGNHFDPDIVEVFLRLID